MRLQFLLKNKCSLRSKIRAVRAASAARGSEAAFWAASGRRPTGGERATPPWKNSTPAHQPGGREESFHPCVRASFGRLNRATVRSLSQGGREELRTSASEAFLRTDGGAFSPSPPGSSPGPQPGSRRSSSPLPPRLLRAPQPGRPAKPFYREAGGSSTPRSDAVRRGLCKTGARARAQR